MKTATVETAARHFEPLGRCRDVEDLEKLNRIGEGMYGAVYRALDRTTRQLREIGSQVRQKKFIDQLEGLVLEAGLKATQRVLALLHDVEAMKRVAPTQRQREEAEQTFGVSEKGMQTEQKKLVDSEVHLVEIRSAEKQHGQCEAMASQCQTSCLSNKLYHGITDRIELAVLNGDLEKRYLGNMNLSFAYVEGDSLLMALKNIAVQRSYAEYYSSVQPHSPTYYNQQQHEYYHSGSSTASSSSQEGFYADELDELDDYTMGIASPDMTTVPTVPTPLGLSMYEHGKTPSGRVMVTAGNQTIEFFSSVVNAPLSRCMYVQE
ncbi:hypothetical protein BBJ28_00018598 [Nothophytophthora sp. Chile5]|nr:hypothetical protein BBJ28_00018598 [Nothophytophthora sp. Chile5]